jgi:hypothetical protein
LGLAYISSSLITGGRGQKNKQHYLDIVFWYIWYLETTASIIDFVDLPILAFLRINMNVYMHTITTPALTKVAMTTNDRAMGYGIKH